MAPRTVINLRTAVDGTVGHEQVLESLRLVFLVKNPYSQRIFWSYEHLTSPIKSCITECCSQPLCITASINSFQMITLFQRALLFKVMAAGDSMRTPRIGGFITSRKEHAL